MKLRDLLLILTLVLSVFVATGGQEAKPKGETLAATSTNLLEAGPILVGTNYAHFGVNNCSVDDRGIIKEYNNENVRATVQNQLAQMRADGVQTLRFIVWFTEDIGSHRWGLLPSATGRLEEPYRTNLQNFMTDIKNTGFARATISFEPTWRNNPSGVDGPGRYDPAKFSENWNFIKDVRGIVKQYGPADTRIDLWNEGAPTVHQASYQQVRDYLKELYRNYAQEFGTSDVTISIIGSSGSGGAQDRLQNLIDLIRESGFDLPGWFEVHIYANEGTTFNDLAIYDDVLTRKGLNQPMVVGESYYNNEQTARGILRFIQERARNIEEVMEWPNEQGGACRDFSALPPYSVSNYSSALQKYKISCSPSSINLEPGALGTSTITASWKDLGGASPGAEVCVGDGNNTPTLFGSGGGQNNGLTQAARWIQSGRNYTFTLHNSGNSSNCTGTPLVQCSVLGVQTGSSQSPSPTPAPATVPTGYFVSWDAGVRDNATTSQGAIGSDQALTLDQTLPDSQEGTKILYARFFYSDGSYRDTQKSIIYRPPQGPSSDSLCTASDIQSLRDCFNRVANNQVDNVEINSQINCSGADACRFTLQNIQRPILVYGTGSSAGFRRTDSYNYPILTVTNSNGIHIKNLKFEENRSDSCSDYNQCSSPVVLGTSQNITLDGVTVENSNKMGIEVSGVDGFIIQNSTIKNVAVFGIWFNDNESYISRNARVENNLFQDNESNGLYISATADANTPSVVRGNTFIHNHRNAVFHVCGPTGNGPCSGGQILIERGVNHLLIEGNTIKDGVIDPYPGEGAAGIEFGVSNLRNVTVVKNDIHNNTGHGIGANDTAEVFPGMVISENKLYNNRWGSIKAPTNATVSNNCESQDCSLALPQGTIRAEPNPCMIANGQQTCRTNIVWSTEGLADVTVNAGGNLFSSNSSGSQGANWITANGATLNLYSGNTLLSSVYVKGVSGETSTSPEPSPKPSIEPNPSSSPSPGRLLRSVGVVLANFTDRRVEPKTRSEVFNNMFNSDSSVKKYFQENSYGLFDIEGDVFGWYMTPGSLTSCNMLQWGQDALQQARLNGIDIDAYDYRIVVLPNYADLCPAWEYSFGPERLIVINAESSSFLRQVSHELGHQIGAKHAHLIRCPNGIDSYEQCRIEDTQDPFDVMSYKDYVSQFSAANKVKLGWIGGSSLVEVRQTGEYTINSLESNSGPRVLKIAKQDTQEWYLVSYRQRTGFDSAIPLHETLEGISIQIAKFDPSFSEPRLVDVNPDINFLGDSNMNDNQVFIDSVNNISIRQISHNNNSAAVTVTFGNSMPSESPAPQTVVNGYFVTWDASQRNAAMTSSGTIATDQAITLDLTLPDSQEGTKILYARFFYSDGTTRDVQQAIIYRVPANETPAPVTPPMPATPLPSAEPSVSPIPSPDITPTPIASPSPGTVQGDINGDGELSIDDYNILVRHFGNRMPQGGSPADLNRDGEVSIDDYNLFVRYFSRR